MTTDKKIPTSPLALRLRHGRLVAGLTLKQLAEAASCSESLISKIERNMAMPSLNTLHRLAAALNTNISDLMREEAPISGPIRRQGERPLIVSGDISLERITLPSRNGLLQANIHIVAEGGYSDGQIEHLGEEVGYVLQGTMELILEDSRHVLETGDAFTFSSQSPHGYRNIGRGELKILWVNTPATF
jgi:transcriptional regulator with XRE-family HTH domain